MAGTKREHDARLRALLLAEAPSFEFAHAIRLLEQTSPVATAPLGHAGPLQLEGVRFVHDPSLSFAASDISRMRERPDGRVEVMGTFLGLLGASSPLPVHFTEEVLEDQSADEHSLRAFYDILHQRLYALFYRATMKYDFASAARADGRDPFTRRAMAFVGVDANAPPSSGLTAPARLALAPVLALRTRSARALAVYLEASLPGVPVEIEPFIGRTVVLEESQRNALGRRNSALGRSLTLGGRVEDRSGRFRTKLGPVDRDAFDGLLPGGDRHEFLHAVLSQFAGGVLEAEVEVLLAGGGPRFRLGDAKASKLGVTTTLGGGREKPTRARFVLDDDPSKVHTELVVEDEVA